MAYGRYTRVMSEIFSATAKNIFDEVAAAMRIAIDGAAADALNRKPGGDDTNSITVLAVHSMHSTHAWLCVATGAPLPARNRDDEFVATMPDATALLAFFDGMVDDCQKLLDESNVADWSAPAKTHARPQGYGEGEVPAGGRYCTRSNTWVSTRARFSSRDSSSIPDGARPSRNLGRHGPSCLRRCSGRSSWPCSQA